MTKDELTKLITNSYTEVRRDHSQVEEIICRLKSIEKEVLETNQNNRAVSFLALKNDLILQNNLNKQNVDNYLKDLLYCIRNDLYSHIDDPEAPIKIFEIIAKIQYAYNILEEKISLKEVYDKQLLEFNSNFSYIFEYKYLSRGKIYFDFYQLSFIYEMHILFINDYDEEIISHASMKKFYKDPYLYMTMINIMFYFKERKLKYYKRGYLSIILEGFNKYNLIY